MKRRRTWCSEYCKSLFDAQHVWSHAKDLAMIKAQGTCARPGCREAGPRLAVVHKVPLGKSRYGMSCAHHEENLVVLCSKHSRALR